ncbi:MAG: HEAT repeat domain-containing protein [Planctomycetota bacterium]
MYCFLIISTVQQLIALWAMIFFIFLCLGILFLTLWVHFKKNRVSQTMRRLEPVYEDLVKSVRFGRTDDDEIKQTVLPKDFPFFQLYLLETISTDEEMDVSAEKRIAEVSGFMDYLKNRIQQTKKMDKAIALRVLSFFRDRENIPLFNEILANTKHPQILFAAAVGLAFCKDFGSFEMIGRKTWDFSQHNPEAVYVLFNAYGSVDRYGPMIAPGVLELLREDKFETIPGRIIAINFLGEFQYRPAASTITKLLENHPSEHIQKACLNTLGLLNDSQCLPPVLPFLEHEDPEFRIAALGAIARTGDAEHLMFIEPFLNDKDVWVRRKAAIAMVCLGADGIAYLEAVAREDKGNPGIAARRVLAELHFNMIDREVI